MTENQKRRITLMRQNHIGYAAIANELKLPCCLPAIRNQNGFQYELWRFLFYLFQGQCH